MTPRNSLLGVLLLLGILNCVHFSTAKGNCEHLRKVFSNATRDFIVCAIHHSEPVKYCQTCGIGFASVVDHYNELFANEECQAKYFNLDRLNILEMVYTNAQSMWNSGSCSNCYDWVDGVQNQTLSNITKEFIDASKNFHNCTAHNSNETVCSECLENYNAVNGIYKDIQKTFDVNICFDIKDEMNKTRLSWSHKFNCCKDRKTSLTTFIVTSVMISVVIPFVFYTSFMFFGWRRDQIQQPLADSDVHISEERTQTVEAIGPVTVPAITHLLDLE